MSFQILISAAQRDYIVKALEFYESAVGQPKPFNFETGAEDPGEYLTGMFKDLKDDDSNYFVDADGQRRQMTHGFCL